MSRIATHVVTVMLLTSGMLMCHCQPTSKESRPCSAARLHVNAQNNEAGSWSLQLGELQGRVNHETGDRGSPEQEKGDFESVLYNRDEGCSDNDVRLFEGGASGTVEGSEGGPAADHERVEGAPVVYKLHTEPVNWTSAENTCQTEGGHLAVPSSDSEAQVLTTVMTRGNEVTSIHLGVYWDSRREDFYTVRGVQLGQAGYEIWGRGQPDYLTAEHACVGLAASREMFVDFCSKNFPFICEIN